MRTVHLVVGTMLAMGIDEARGQAQAEVEPGAVVRMRTPKGGVVCVLGLRCNNDRHGTVVGFAGDTLIVRSDKEGHEIAWAPDSWGELYVLSGQSSRIKHAAIGLGIGAVGGAVFGALGTPIICLFCTEDEVKSAQVAAAAAFGVACGALGFVIGFVLPTDHWTLLRRGGSPLTLSVRGTDRSLGLGIGLSF